jgi:hypothetical protein
MLRSLCLVVAITFVACAPCSAQTCPSSTLVALTSSVTTSDDARTVSVSGWCFDPHYANSRGAIASIALRTGECYASAHALVECDANATVHAHDVFTLSGPGSAPIAFNAALLIHASRTTSEYQYAQAALTEGATNQASFGLTVASRDTTINVTIVRAPGETFDLVVDLHAFGGGAYTGGAGTISTTVSFPDLPPGYGLISCHGYQAGSVVPAHESTWGKLKTLYRR